MNNRLLTYLENHEASERIKDLKLDKKMVNAENENGQSPLQLAAQYGRPDLVLFLLTEGAEIKQVNYSVRHQHPLIVQTLAACLEKKSDPAVIAGIYCYALNRNAHELSERMTKHLPPAAKVEAKFTDRQSRLYELAETKQKSMMVKGWDKMENYAVIFSHAYAVKNYDAVRTILSGCEDHIALLEEILTTEQNDCVPFLIVAAAMDLYEIALHLHKNKPKLLEKFIRLAWNKEGLLQGLIEKSIIEDQPPAGDILALIKILQQPMKKEDMDLLFERAVSERHQLRFTVKTAHQLSEEENELVYSLGCRLNLPILRHNEDELKVFINCLPVDLHDIVLGYCDQGTQTSLTGSSFFKARIGLLSKPLESKKSAQIQHLNTQLRLLNEFITATELELAGKTRWSHCGQLYGKGEKLLFFLFLAALVVNSAFLGYTVPKINPLKEILKGELWGPNIPCYYPDAPVGLQCQDECTGCPEFKTFSNWEIGFGIGVGLSGLALLVLVYNQLIPTFRSQQPQRFNNLPLTSFNIRTRAAAESMLAEFKGTLFNPFETSRMESKVGDVLGIARRERDARKGELASLEETKAEHAIDINDNDFEAVAEVDDRTLSLNTARTRLLP